MLEAMEEIPGLYREYRVLHPSVPFMSLLDCEDLLNSHSPMFNVYRIKSRVAVSDMDPGYGQPFPQDQFFLYHPRCRGKGPHQDYTTRF